VQTIAPPMAPNGANNRACNNPGISWGQTNRQRQPNRAGIKSGLSIKRQGENQLAKRGRIMWILWITCIQPVNNLAIRAIRAKICKVIHSFCAKWPKLSTFAGPLGQTAIEGYSHPRKSLVIGFHNQSFVSHRQKLTA
jgi:hypothetical protein